MFKTLGLVLCLFFGVGSLWAADPLQLVTEEWPPYSFLKDGKPSGSDIDVLNAVAKDTGLSIVFDFVPWSRALEMVKLGKTDGIFSLYDLPERHEFLEFPADALGTENLVLIVRAADPPPGPLKSVKDLTGLRVGVTQDNNNGPEFDGAKNFTREIALNTETGLSKLAGKRMDAFVVNKANFLSTVAAHPEWKSEFKIAPYLVNHQALFVGFSKEAMKTRAIPVARISASLAKLRANGTIRAIEERYFGK